MTHNDEPRTTNPERPMIHLSEDELVLHYYGEMSSNEETRAAAHLMSCPACHENLRRLQRVLAVVDEGALSGPELSEHFERTVWARLEPNLHRAGGGWLSWFILSPSRLVWVATVVVLVGAAFWRAVCSRGPRTHRHAPPTIFASESCSWTSATISIDRRWCSSSS
jgi:anti-sigma factor RsiW